MKTLFFLALVASGIVMVGMTPWVAPAGAEPGARGNFLTGCFPTYFPTDQTCSNPAYFTGEEWVYTATPGDPDTNNGTVACYYNPPSPGSCTNPTAGQLVGTGSYSWNPATDTGTLSITYWGTHYNAAMRLSCCGCYYDVLVSGNVVRRNL